MSKKIFVLICSFTFLISTASFASEDQKDAHTYLKGPSFHQKSKKIFVSKEDHALALAMYSVLRYDSSELTKEQSTRLATKIIEASKKVNIDPFSALTIVFLESRFRVNAIGDGGNACGLAQQHARFSVHWPVSDNFLFKKKDSDEDKRRKIKEECKELATNPDYAIDVFMYHLSFLRKRFGPMYKNAWRYNGKQEYMRKFSYWRKTLKKTYQKVLEQWKEYEGKR